MKKLLILFAVLALIAGCSDTKSTEPNFTGFKIIRSNGKIQLEDQTGKLWDITHAVNNYNFKPEKFQFGVGPNAIPPILEPQYYCPGDVGYPSTSSDFQVIGYKSNGSTRAYSLNVMINHEVANEQFGNQYVAVAY